MPLVGDPFRFLRIKAYLGIHQHAIFYFFLVCVWVGGQVGRQVGREVGRWVAIPTKCMNGAGAQQHGIAPRRRRPPSTPTGPGRWRFAAGGAPP